MQNTTTLSSDQLLQANLAALRASAGAAPELVTGGRRVRLENTPAGPSASIEAPDGRWIRIHSGRNPAAEADRLVSCVLRGTPPPLVVLVGAGLGYALDAIERRSPSTRVLVIEPLPDVAAAMLTRRAWQDWTSSERLRLLVGPDYTGASEAWRFIGADADDPPVVVASVFEREFPDETARARQVADQTVFGAKANAKALGVGNSGRGARSSSLRSTWHRRPAAIQSCSPALTWRTQTTALAAEERRSRRCGRPGWRRANC